MPTLISVMLSTADATSILNNLQQADTTFTPVAYNLTDDKRSGLRSMAEGREGIARSISQIAVANPDDLSRRDDPQELVTKLNYDATLESIRQVLVKLNEKVEETQQANAHDIMKLVDAYTAALQTNRSRNSALDEALKPIDEYNKRFGRDQSGTTPPNP